MRLTDLFARQVVDRDGTDAGSIRDVRVEIVPAPDGTVAALRIEGLIAGHGAVGERFGYAYGQARGPWVLAAPMRWLARHTRYVAWSQVRQVNHDRVIIEGPADELPSVVSVEEHPS